MFAYISFIRSDRLLINRSITTYDHAANFTSFRANVDQVLGFFHHRFVRSVIHLRHFGRFVHREFALFYLRKTHTHTLMTRVVIQSK